MGKQINHGSPCSNLDCDPNECARWGQGDDADKAVPGSRFSFTMTYSPFETARLRDSRQPRPATTRKRKRAQPIATGDRPDFKSYPIRKQAPFRDDKRSVANEAKSGPHPSADNVHE